MVGGILIADIQQRKANDSIRAVTVVHDWGLLRMTMGVLYSKLECYAAPLVQSNLR